MPNSFGYNDQSTSKGESQAAVHFFSKILYFGEQGELGVSIEPMHAPAVSALWAYKGSLICQTVLG